MRDSDTLRLGIFLFYDACGIVDQYVTYLLEHFSGILQKLVIVVNGSIKPDEKVKFQCFTRHMLIRENRGYDAGGYKDALISYLVQETWTDWDEIVLFNDTFYGPLYSWKTVFGEMKLRDVDFWGLSRCPGGKFPDGGHIPPHIQGYFLVCRRPLFLSQAWKQFWEELPYPETFREAVENFEIRFSTYFLQCGFMAGAYTDPLHTPYGGNPYVDHLWELIRSRRMPVIKRKAFLLCGHEQIQKTLDYIGQNTEYDIRVMYDHLCRLQEEGLTDMFPPFDTDRIESFYKAHDRVFIYGYGKYARNLGQYFRYKKWTCNGYLVSGAGDGQAEVYTYKNMRFQDKDGVILALGRKAFGEVYPVVSINLGPEQLLLPVYE